jgi:hypothetical protein
VVGRTQQREQLGVLGFEHQGSPEEFRGLRVPAALQGDEPQQVQGGGVLRRLGQGGLEQGLGLVPAAGAVVLRPLGEEFLGTEHGSTSTQRRPKALLILRPPGNTVQFGVVGGMKSLP